MEKEINSLETNNAFAMDVNKRVVVRLNEYGMKLLKENYIRVYSNTGLTSEQLEEQAEKFVKKYCKNGYYKDQLRSLMRTFGRFEGLVSPFEGNKIYFIEDGERGAERTSDKISSELLRILK